MSDLTKQLERNETEGLEDYLSRLERVAFSPKLFPEGTRELALRKLVSELRSLREFDQR